jgi:hypothetical protein
MEAYLYKRKADLIIYHIQSNEQIHLSDKSRHDIHSNMYQSIMDECERAREREEYWEKSYTELKEKGFPLKYNEIRIRVAKEKEPIHPDKILEWMLMLDDGISIR